MSFKETLRTELEYRGLMVKELAAATGISRHTLDNYLCVRSQTPSADVAVKIAQFLGVSVEYLVTGSEISNSKTLTPLNPEIRALTKMAESLDADACKTLLTIAKALTCL